MQKLWEEVKIISPQNMPQNILEDEEIEGFGDGQGWRLHIYEESLEGYKAH